jgi:Zn-dependent peptidase ImmA (M78 family)
MRNRKDLQLEQEANYFACCILMPPDLFLDEWAKIREQTNDDDEQIKKLSKIFDVPLFAVVMRMAQINGKMWLEK